MKVPPGACDCHVHVFGPAARFLKTRNVYLKLSGPHRLPMDPGPVVRALVAANPERCLWGSDWPHPASGARNQRLHRWVGDAALFRKILVDNPARLYDF